MESFARVGVGEVFLLVAPSGDRIDHARDELAHAGLAPRRAERSAKIFRDDDVGGGLRPRARHFDVLLLEDDAAVFARDDGAAHVPFDLRIRIDAGGGEETLEHDAASGCGGSDRSGILGRCAVGCFWLGIHLKIHRSPAHHQSSPTSVTCLLSPRSVSVESPPLLRRLSSNPSVSKCCRVRQYARP